MPELEGFLGPLGALVLAVAAVGALVTERITPGARTKRAEDLARQAVDGWRAEQQTLADLVRALEERNELEDRHQALDRLVAR
jgi:hypothetical protein